MTDYKATRYQINTWGSHPDAGNDDWWTSVNAGDTIEEARAFFSTYRGRAFDSHLELVEIVGDEVMERIAIRNNPAFVECDEGDDGDGGEWAMLQGMAFGCDAYNEARGC
jgi:hypothetical protein